MTAAATLEPVLGLTITGALLPLMPDIIIGTKNHASLEKTYSATLHELSHATHYFGLGTNGKEVWIREYYDMLSGWGKMIADGKSPFEDCYNNGGTDLVKLIESWGYFSEKDGIKHRWSLCENCYDKLIRGFAIPVEELDMTDLL